MKHNPPLTGGNELERVCGLEVTEDPVNVCGKVASKHIAWNRVPDFSYVCAKHEGGILAKYRYWMAHKMGPYCGMPGAFFDPQENTCKMSDEGIPVVKDLREDLITEEPGVFKEPARSLNDFAWKRRG